MEAASDAMVVVQAEGLSACPRDELVGESVSQINLTRFAERLIADDLSGAAEHRRGVRSGNAARSPKVALRILFAPAPSGGRQAAEFRRAAYGERRSAPGTMSPLPPVDATNLPRSRRADSGSASRLATQLQVGVRNQVITERAPDL